MPLHKPVERRLLDRTYMFNDCLIWTGCYFLHTGYGSITYNNKQWSAHRLAYEVFKGDIPSGLYVDHLCRNRGCINVEHMELVTPSENVLRGIGITAVNKRKTHCKRGHEFTPDNTYIDWRGDRNCKECRRHYKRIYRQRAI